MQNSFITEKHSRGNRMVLGSAGSGKGFIGLNRNNLSDPNAIFLGKPGYGLGHFTKKEIMGLIQENEKNRVFVVDTWGEYAKWIRDIGGEVITISSVANIKMPSDNRIVCYDLGMLEGDLNIVATVTVIDTIWNSVEVNYKNKERCYIYVDDAARAFESSSTGNCIVHYFKRSRPKGFIMTLISRNPDILLGSDSAKDVLIRAECVVLLGQKKDDIESLVELYDLSDTQVHFINNSCPGDGLIIAGKDIFTMNDFSIMAAV